jgi:hypothetical protein
MLRSLLVTAVAALLLCCSCAQAPTDTSTSSRRVPVLAFFGERDSQVDWRRTKALYERTIGTGAQADLTVKVLPDCNHNIQRCRTGGYRERSETPQPCAGYYDALLTWLTERGFGR